jgi:hypothetical protein
MFSFEGNQLLPIPATSAKPMFPNFEPNQYSKTGKANCE